MPFRDLEFSEKATYLGYPILRLAELTYFSTRRDYITVSEWMKKQLHKMFRLQDCDIRVIHNSVDTNVFTPGNEDQRRIVLITGRLIAAKGLIYLVEAIPRILRNHPDTLFTFLGPGDPRPYVTRLQALQVPASNFIFTGYLKERSEILEYYRRCAIFVAPTLYENLPIRILEAMACAKPVVATDVCAIPEAITSGRDGILVPPRSSDALVETISSLLESPKRRYRIGQSARETIVERFDWTVNANRTALFYEEVLAS
jgi:glycosyltransferase involved in cell wall biosynthesis